MSVAEKITSIETHIGNAYQGLANLGADLTNVDKNIDNIASQLDTIYSNLPKVTGTGTNISLTPTYKGKLESTVKGNIEQDTLTGKNYCFTNYLEWELGEYNFSGEKVVNNGRCRTKELVYVPSGITLYLNSFSTNSQFVIRAFDINKGYLRSYGAINSGSTLGIQNDVNYLGVILYNPNSSASTEGQSIIDSIQNGTCKPFICNNTVTDKNFEEYCGGIPSPNPSYPQNIKVVTGDNTITISNADNTHSTSYPISLGSLELCKIGTYQDYIYKDSGKWYKYGAIGKVVLNGSESENWQQNNSQTLTNTYYFSSNKIDGILKSGEKNGFSNYFNVVNELWNTDVQGLQFSTSNSNIRIRIDKTIISDTASLKLWLGTHNTILYYILNTSTSTEITDDGLIGQLNNLEKAMSENGTTNISSTYESGNSQMIITASSLKGN